MVMMPGVLEEQLAVVGADLGGVDARACRAGRASPRTARPRGTAIRTRHRPSSSRAACTRSTSSAQPQAGSVAAEAPEQVVVAPAAAQRRAERGVVDLEHRARVVAERRAPGRGRRSRARRRPAPAARSSARSGSASGARRAPRRRRGLRATSSSSARARRARSSRSSPTKSRAASSCEDRRPRRRRARRRGPAARGNSDASPEADAVGVQPGGVRAPRTARAIASAVPVRPGRADELDPGLQDLARLPAVLARRRGRRAAT